MIDKKLKYKSGFTLIELTICLTIFSFVVVGVIMALNRTYFYSQSTKQQIIGLNLAREGMEMMQNIRDTNWKRYSSSRDKCWLKMDISSYDNCDSSDSSNSSKLLTGGIFLLMEKVNEQTIFALSGAVLPSGETGRFESGYNKFWDAVGMDKNQFVVSGTFDQNIDFYRMVRVFGIYKKDVSDSDKICNDVTCKTDHTPKEVRYCVKVFWNGNNRGDTELCGILTNFKE